MAIEQEFEKIPYLSGERLRQAVIAGAQRVIAKKDVLDRINVFPVPDWDTGSNLAATMRAVIRGLNRPQVSFATVSKTLASSALAGARGNSGVIMAQFFQGLREGVADQINVSVAHFVRAATHAATRAREALAIPQEGTILTVIADFADHMAQQAGRLGDFLPLLEEGLKAARLSLAETTERLAVLRKAGVVDAGALGFVHFLEGFVEYFREGSAGVTVKDKIEEDHFEVRPERVSDRIDFRYCTEAVLAKTTIDHTALKQRLMELGDSVVVAGTDQEAHVHVHSNVPAHVLELLDDVGEIHWQRVEDMFAQFERASLESTRTGIAIVTDSVCDLPLAFLAEKRIHVIPLRVAFGEEEFVDRVELTPRQFYRRLAASKSLPKTSQPVPAEFLHLYRYLTCHYVGILSIHLSSEVSGTVQGAINAARTVSKETGVPIKVVDTKTASAGAGLVVWAASRAAEAGFSLEVCDAVARAAAARTSVFVFVPTVDYFVRGGRLSPIQGRIAKLLCLTPILTVNRGRIAAAGKTIGRRRAMRKVLACVKARGEEMESPVFVVAHTAAPGLAEHYAGKLRQRFPPSLVMVADAAAALGAHAGPGGAAIAVVDAGPIERMINAAVEDREA